MKTLMFLRDPLPPSRPDVVVLFDRELRRLGLATDFVGRGGSSATVPAHVAVVGAMHVHRGHAIGALWFDLTQLIRRVRAYDLVVVRDKPISGALLLLVARLIGRAAVYWMSFPMPLGDRVSGRLHIARGRWLKGALVWLRGAVAERVLHRFTLPLADAVFVQSEAMKRSLGPRLGRAEHVFAVPMGVDADALRAQVEAPFEVSAPAEVQVVIYLGTLDRARRLDVLLAAFGEVWRQQPASRLWLVGGVDHDEDLGFLHEEVARLQLQDVVSVLPPRPMHEAWQLAQSASLGVSPIPPGPLFDVSSPTKVVEYLALGLPVVATRIPDQEQLLRDCGGGRCVAFEPAALAQAMLDILRELPHWRAQAKLARERVIEIRSYARLAETVLPRLRAALG